MRYKIVFWDIDGTIFHGDDPPEGFVGCPSMAENRRTAIRRAEQVLSMFGHQPPADLQPIITHLHQSLSDQLGLCFNLEILAGRLYEHLGLTARKEESLLLADALWGPRYRPWLYRGCAESLHALHRAGVSMGVITNNSATARMIRNALTGVGLADCFRSITCSCEAGARKPDSRIFNTALAAHPARPESRGKVLYVGDNPLADIEGATACGWDAALHLTAHEAAPRPSQAVISFTDYRQLREFILNHKGM